MARRAFLVAAGSTRYGESPVGVREMVREAVSDCFASADKGLDGKLVREAFVGSLGFGGAQIGNLAAALNDLAALRLVSARRVENACASGGFALRDAVLAVRAGASELALAVGVERMNDQPPARRGYWLGVSGETEWERMAGLTFPGVYALMAARHMHEFGTTPQDMAAVAVKNHAFGALNPKAQFRRPVTAEAALASPMVASPFTVYDCCSTTDGAAAVVVASEEAARAVTDTPVEVLASAGSSDHLAAHQRASLTRLDATVRAGRDAFAQAGVAATDIDVAELHDCFTIAEILALEDLGFAKKGAGGPFTREGQSDLGGKVAVNTSGGLKAKGHPLGATGVGQAYELFRQLRQEAEAGRQVEGAKLALAHNVGGSGATCAVHIFSR